MKLMSSLNCYLLDQLTINIGLILGASDKRGRDGNRNPFGIDQNAIQYYANILQRKFISWRLRETHKGIHETESLGFGEQKREVQGFNKGDATCPLHILNRYLL